MNARGDGNTSAKNWLTWAFARPPFIGLFPFAVFFISQGLGHSVMIQMEESMGEPGMYYFAGAMGLLGAVVSLGVVALCLGMPAGKKERERMAAMQQELSAS